MNLLFVLIIYATIKVIILNIIKGEVEFLLKYGGRLM